MGVAHLEILVEEDSMEAALRELLPKLAGDMSFAIHRHQGKADLLRKLPKRLCCLFEVPSTRLAHRCPSGLR